LVLFAAVAVFSSVANVGSRNAGNIHGGASVKGSNVILTADGGAPYPRPPASSTVAS
jgi:hypothetical protein